MFFRKRIICQMKRDSYSLFTGSSNVEGFVKMNPLLVRVFDDEKGKVISQLFNMGTCKFTITENLFGSMDKIILEAGVPWENCVAVGVTNTAVNIGSRNCITLQTRVLSPSEEYQTST